MNLIALVDQKWGIAQEGRQICHIPDDLRHFRELTMGGTVIMGRKTYEAIGHPLKGRRNIVVSRTLESLDGAEVVHDLIDPEENAWVIGGESIYRELLPCCSWAYVTMVHADLGADQFAPDLDVAPNWTLAVREAPRRFGGLGIEFREYRRKPPGAW